MTEKVACPECGYVTEEVNSLKPSGAVDRGTIRLFQFDPEVQDRPWAVYEERAGTLRLLSDGRTAGEALAEAGEELATEDGPRGGYW